MNIVLGKKANKGTDKITEKEFNALKESVKPRAKYSWENYLGNYKKFKSLKEGADSKITYKELKMLRENWREAEQKGIRLREADMGMDPMAAAGAMPGDPNAMAGMDPAMAGMGDPSMAGMADPTMAGAQDPTMALSQIAQIANGAMGAGGANPNPLGADPMAGMPPVAGMDPSAAMGGMDPAAAAGAPMMEKMINDYRTWKLANKGTDRLTEAEISALREEVEKNKGPQTRYQQIKSRIAERQARIAALQEGYLDIPSTAEMGTLTSKPHVSNSHGGDHSVSEEQVKVPNPLYFRCSI